MAKCDLSIELDQPDAVYEGGGTIAGVVRVIADGDVNCSALEVQSGWRTHGRGNIASGTGEQTTLFSGQWHAGERYEYRFELSIAEWPPSYHGHYLNVDHFIDARAKIPWGYDPTASAPFLMRPVREGEGARVSKNVTEMNGLVGWIVGFLAMGLLIAFLVGMIVAGPFALVFLAFPLLGGVIWFFRKFLPRWLLGEVRGHFPIEMVSPGESAEGELTIEPKRGVSINGITLVFRAREECVSGSGSNRKTHTYVLFERTEVLEDAITLAPGVKHRFPLNVTFPPDAPFTLDLDDNQLIWSATLRVDIPKWPDWVNEIPLKVVPSAKVPSEQLSQGVSGAAAASAPPAISRSDSAADQQTIRGSQGRGRAEGGSAGVEDETVTFAETASHLWSARDQHDQVELLVEAVCGLTFDLEAVIERRLLYSGDDDPHVYADGYAVWAHHTKPPLPLVLYVPHALADEFEQIGRDTWRGRGTIVGWDQRHGRLQVKVEVA
jgi:hypothetical protein